MRYFQPLSVPNLVHLEKDMEFVVVTEIDITEMKNNIIFMRGKTFNYEDGIVEEIGVKEIQYSLSEDGHCEVDENGKPIIWEE